MPVPITHVLYGGGPADFVGSGSSGSPLIITGGAQLSVWSASVGGTIINDLYDLSQDTVEIVTADSFGNFGVYAPAAYGTVYVSTDNGVTRYPIQPADLGRQVGTLREQVANISIPENPPPGGGTGPGLPEIYIASSEADAANAPEGSLILVRRDA